MARGLAAVSAAEGGEMEADEDFVGAWGWFGK